MPCERKLTKFSKVFPPFVSPSPLINRRERHHLSIYKSLPSITTIMSSREVANPPRSATLNEIQNIESLNKKLTRENKGLKEELKAAQAETVRLQAEKKKVQDKKDTLIDQIKRMKQRKETIDKQIKIIEDMSEEKDKSTLPFEQQVTDLQNKTIKAVNSEKDKLEQVIRTLKEVYETKHQETQTEQFAPIDQSLAEAVRKCHVAVGENQELTEKKRQETESLGGTFNAKVEGENRRLKAQEKKLKKKAADLEKKLEAAEGKKKSLPVADSNPRKRKGCEAKQSSGSAKKKRNQSPSSSSDSDTD